MKRKPPVGSEWRILAHGASSSIDIRSKDYDPARAAEGNQSFVENRNRTIFDELVIRMGNDTLHLEQMDTRTWCLILGDEIRMLTVDRSGKLIVGEMYR